MVTWLLPQGTGAYPPFMPDDVTTVFPGVQARAVVFLTSPLVEYAVPVLVLVILLAHHCHHSDGSHVPPSSSLPLLYNNPCWCHRAYTISLTHIRCTTSPYVRTSVGA
jgi:hypothetical protein